MSIVDAISKCVSILAVVGGAVWTVVHFYQRRESQTALTIDMAATSMEYSGSLHLVNFDVCLTNKGQVDVRAERKIRPAYEDNDERIDYGGELLIRRIASGLMANHAIDWFTEDHQHSPESTDLQSDLLRVFRNAEGLTDFWMEPGESYHLSSAYALERGNYLVMITFVGNRGPTDFWRRLFLVQVPTAVTTSGSEHPVAGHD
jgi:hypothetical protein